MAKTKVGSNVEVAITGNNLILTIDLAEEQGLSTSGKNMVVASTHGNVDLPGKPGWKLGVNCYHKPTT